MIVKMMKNYIADLKHDFWGTIKRWQDHRFLWLLGGGIALSLELFSWLYFQNYIGLNPCEYCVYIRFSMLVIFIGAMVGAIQPKNLFFKFSAYIIVIWGIARGVIWDIALEIENLKTLQEHYISTCSMGKIKFPFGLPLADWLPTHFEPLAFCGAEDSRWLFFGLNMAEWLFFVYALFTMGILLMLISFFVCRYRKNF